MKIGILTQPLHSNYGGLLQAFALQHHLKGMGHDVVTIDFVSNKKPRFFGLKGIVLNLIKKYIRKEKVKYIFPVSEKEIERIGINTQKFIERNIELTKRFTSIEELYELNNENFDAFVVGSDQVWRPIYSPGISAFFLDFVKRGSTVKISYAASFGTDNCDEYTKDEIAQFTELLKDFNAVSVREDTGVELCRNHFKTNAVHVIDPTLLLSPDVYSNLVVEDNTPPSKGDLMAYVLDRNPDKQKIIDHVAKRKGLSTLYVMPDDNNDIYPNVTTWIKGFIDSKFVVTDSFHGMVFSIIFNKPFIAIGNKDRGLSRFSSLLRKFNLTERLIYSYGPFIDKLCEEEIDYSIVNKKLVEEQDFANEFLLKSLSRRVRREKLPSEELNS